MPCKNRKRQDKLPIRISRLEVKFGSKTKIDPKVKPMIQKKVTPIPRGIKIGKYRLETEVR